VLGQDLGKSRIFGKEAVAGMDGVGAGDLAGRDERGDVEIALGGRRRADANAFVGQAHMHGVLVGRGMNGHRLYAKLAAGTQHSERDLAPVGDQDLVEHRPVITR
jgi:hypothetical protein